MHTPYLKAARTISIWAALYILVACDTQPEFTGHILAKVGDRVITSEDFMRRAEYTIRPDYCAGDNYIHRKIVLNSLIAEKLLAYHVQDLPLNANENFQAYIQGRREQSMRQWLKKTEGLDKVTIDSIQVKAAYRLSGRTYEIQYLSLPDSQAASDWNRTIQDGYNYSDIASALLGSDTIPHRSISWFDREVESIWEILFENAPEKGSTVGPVPTESGEYVVFHIQGWVDRPAITNSDIEQRWFDVQDRMIERKADKRYREYVGTLMSGKELHLSRSVFFAYAKKVSAIYLKTSKEKEALLNKAIWNAEEHLISEELEDLPEVNGEEILFEIDGQKWSIDQFESFLKRHPLVFRKLKMSTQEFSEQFKYAIADLVRDHYLTEKAYDLGYDQIQNVVQYTQTWSDHYVSRHERNRYLQSRLGSEDSLERKGHIALIETYLNPYIDSLQATYSNKIYINTDMVEGLELSKIPMMVSNRNVPFLLAVPSFPQLTTDDRLDYGKQIANEE